MKTDRELLEYAAKAAGFGDPEGGRFCWTESEYPRNSGKHGALWNYVGHMDSAELWNPLTDDGDALRLGVKRHVFFNPLFAHYLALERFGNQDADDTKAYRRAIVRTVAAIGENMA